MNKTLALVLIVLFIILGLLGARAPMVSASPHLQATATRTPTDEPTKPPYIFPTPIFIPTYPGDTPAPRATPRSSTDIPVPTTDTYIVQSGDSPWIIAQKVYGDGTKYRLIMEANGLTDQTKLRVGTVLKIPSPANATPSPIATPTATMFAPTPPTITQASPTPTAPAVFITPTPTRASSNITGNITDLAGTILTIVAGSLLVAALICATLAALIFYRTWRMQETSGAKKRIQIRR